MEDYNQDEPRESLYPNLFSIKEFIQVIESGQVWNELI